MILAVWGDEKTTKSTTGLSAPQPLALADFDLGIERALPRFRGQEIEVQTFPMPIQIGLKLEGVKEVWADFMKWFIKQVNDPRIKTIMIDTGTQEYEVCRFGYLQELQEAQITKLKGKEPEKLRERLLPIEYAEPYSRLKAIIYAARGRGKNLILTHYSTDVYASRLDNDGKMVEYKTGEVKMDGFKWTEGLVDVVLHTYLKNEGGVDVPYGVITLSGLHLGMKGVVLKEPTYEQIENLPRILRGEGIEEPEEGSSAPTPS